MTRFMRGAGHLLQIVRFDSYIAVKYQDVDLSITKVGDTVRRSVLLARTMLDETRRVL